MAPNVNFFELKNCLDDLSDFLGRHYKKLYAKQYTAAVERAKEGLHGQIAQTDERYTQWRFEVGQEKLALKHLQRAYKRAQRKLKEVGALDYPEDVVTYWDEAHAIDGGQRMLAYLRERGSALDFAAEMIAEFEKLLDKSHQEGREENQALLDYRRISGSRKTAMEKAIEVIDVVRRAAREDLGAEHADYLAVRWPAMVAPDPF